ncbi:DEAD/DEAH box helicase [Colletotrichum tofieldiae]|nr:DEAD/DEAH box helicase [Colletotrichum tofieldiae]
MSSVAPGGEPPSVQKPKGKRKRPEDEAPVASEAEATFEMPGDGASKTEDVASTVDPRVTKSKKRTAPKKAGSALNRTDSTASAVECKIEWPEHFKALEKTHRALNLVFTFCCTRKHLATTFETIKSAVESHTRTSLTIEDVAAIAAIRPEGVNFAYVDEVMLQTEVRGAERDVVFKKGRDFLSQAPAPDASVGGISGFDELDHHPNDPVEGGKEVLYFEFVDGDLKRQVRDKKTGEITKPNRKLREETLKMPVYSQKQMTSLIERRNQKFSDAVSLFINQCVAESMDPELRLAIATEAHIPVPAMPEPVDKKLGALPESIPMERKSIPEIVQELKDGPWYTGQIVPDGHRVFEPQEPVYGDLNFLLSQDLVNALYNSKGITQFFAHQTEAINGLLEGQHVVVSTSTSSGKSLIYQLPVIHALERDWNTRAMYIFPTKALAQDQKRSLRELMSYMPGMEEVLVDTFDGDTPMNERNLIRDEARIIFTNPDMLHITILPQEERWRTFLKNLKYVVVDELHYYNGQMGSHVAFIMRRLRRICAAVGNRHIKFISCSATVANPKQHFKTIFGIENVRLVDFDGSPSGRKEFLCWNTPYKDPGDPASGRGDAMLECARLFCQLMLRGVRIIAFTRVREQCEKLVTAVQQELESLGRPECVNRVMGYRGGYTAQDRRRIESEMFEGKLLGIVATTALELGIDIGTLDCVLTWGFRTPLPTCVNRAAEPDEGTRTHCRSWWGIVSLQINITCKIPTSSSRSRTVSSKST